MWVLELVTLVSVLQRQSRRLLLVLGGQNERAVLYGRQPDTNEAEAGRRPGHSWTREAPPGQGLLPRRPACSPDHMPGTPRPPTLLQHNTALLLRLAPHCCPHCHVHSNLVRSNTLFKSRHCHSAETVRRILFYSDSKNKRQRNL